MINHGFVRVCAAVPTLKVSDCKYNSYQIRNMIEKAENLSIQFIVFPELCITAYTCGDLFHQQELLNQSILELENIVEYSRKFKIVSIIGCPIRLNNQLFNCAIILQQGKILGVVPKTYIPGYGEFYEERWFSSARGLRMKEAWLCNQTVPIGNDLIFEDSKNDVCFAVEICEDLWTPIPPSSFYSMEGALFLFNLSASNEIIGKYEYRKQCIMQQSAKCIASYIYTSSGAHESSTDLVFGGYAAISEYGSILVESERFKFEEQLIYHDIDADMLKNLRLKNTVFMEHNTEFFTHKEYRKVNFNFEETKIFDIKRTISPHPFVPTDERSIDKRCKEIFEIQTAALANRLSHVNSQSLIIGVSGGLDSSLALLVAANTCDKLNLPRSFIHGISMPGFGTSKLTRTNSNNLMKALGITISEIDITDACKQHFLDIGHDAEIHDVVFENVQARERTQILMDIANKKNGLVIGTADLSELALGWCTYNGDHMSMYCVNSGIPKTLIKFLIQHTSKIASFQNVESILAEILNTPITPELIPTDKEGKITQKTENILGPYELHDFFIYHMIRHGHSPAKILFMAELAFGEKYNKEFMQGCLNTFYNRFFSNQFKRSCIPDGPKVGSISLSPRGDWRMPSDASLSWDDN